MKNRSYRQKSRSTLKERPSVRTVSPDRYRNRHRRASTPTAAAFHVPSLRAGAAAHVSVGPLRAEARFVTSAPARRAGFPAMELILFRGHRSAQRHGAPTDGHGRHDCRDALRGRGHRERVTHCPCGHPGARCASGHRSGESLHHKPAPSRLAQSGSVRQGAAGEPHSHPDGCCCPHLPSVVT